MPREDLCLGCGSTYEVTHECPVDPKFNSKKPAGRNRSGVPVEHLCDLCGHLARDLFAYRSHFMAEHTRLLVCKICGSRLSSQPQLRSHYVQTHLKLKPFKCTICGHAAANTTYMIVHYKSIHNLKIKGKDMEVDEKVMEEVRVKGKEMMERYSPQSYQSYAFPDGGSKLREGIPTFASFEEDLEARGEEESYAEKPVYVRKKKRVWKPSAKGQGQVPAPEENKRPDENSDEHLPWW